MQDFVNLLVEKIQFFCGYKKTINLNSKFWYQALKIPFLTFGVKYTAKTNSQSYSESLKRLKNKTK